MTILSFVKVGYQATIIDWSKIISSGTIGGGNNPPTISSLTANPTSVSTGAVSTITCTASDPDGDTLSYSWTKTGGTISGSGSSVTWTATASSGTYTITSTVSDGKGGSDTENVNVTVTAQYLIVGWQSETIPNTDGAVENYSAIDQNQIIHVAFIKRSDTQDSIMYTKLNGTSWSTPEILDSNYIINDVSLTLDSNGNPNIAYSIYTSGGIGYLKYTNWTGSSWSPSTAINQTGVVFEDVSIALNSQEQPWIAYRSSSGGKIGLAQWNGSLWIKDETVGTGYSPVLGIEMTNDVPVIVYINSSYRLILGRKIVGSWTAQSLDSDANTVGGWPSLKISGDKIHIAYWSSIEGYLKYLYRDELLLWNNPEVVAQTDNSAQVSCISLDSLGNPYIVYDSDDGIKRDTKVDVQWNTKLIAIGDPGTFQFCSAFFDSNGKMHVIYSMNGLQHAKQTQ